MKKRFILSILFAFSLLALVGCFAVETVRSISLLSQPKSEYLVGEQVNHDDFVIKVTLDNGTFKEVKGSEVTITDFSTDAAGTFTGKIIYQGVSVTFEYKVIPQTQETGFAGGNGTKTNPYKVASYAQFLNIESSTTRAGKTIDDVIYYKLETDIEIPNVNSTYAISMAVNAVIDGNNKTLISNKRVFNNAYKLELKNLNVILGGKGTLVGNIKNYSEYLDSENNTPHIKKLIFNNINVYCNVFTDDTFYGVFVLYPYVLAAAAPYNKNYLEVINCTVNGAIYSTGNSSGTLFGYLDNVESVKVENTIINSNITGNAAAAIGSPYGTAKSVTITNTTFNGTLSTNSTNVISSGFNGNSSEIISSNNIKSLPTDANLFSNLSTLNLNEEIKINASQNVAKYIIRFSLNVDRNPGGTDGGYPRFYERTIYNFSDGILNTGVYKRYVIEIAREDGKEDYREFGLDESSIIMGNLLLGSLYEATVDGKQVILMNEEGYYISISNGAKQTVHITVYGYSSTGELVSYKTDMYESTKQAIENYLGMNFVVEEE